MSLQIKNLEHERDTLKADLYRSGKTLTREKRAIMRERLRTVRQELGKLYAARKQKSSN